MVRSAERACPDDASHRRENHEGQVLARGHPSRRPPLAGGPRFSNLLGSPSEAKPHRTSGRSDLEARQLTLARIPNKLAPNHKHSREWITTCSGNAGGV